jgi:hypothetical protein
MDDRYIMSLCRYIHRNPLKAGLVENLSEYPWSSYPDLCGKRNDTLVNRRFWSDYFDGSVTKELHELVEGVAYEHVLEPAPQIKQPPLICTNDVKNEKRPDLDVLAAIIAKAFQVSTSEVQGESRAHNCVLARKQFIIEAVRNHAYRRSEVARYLNKDRSLVTKVLERQ